MDKGSFALVLIAVLAATAGSAVTYSITKQAPPAPAPAPIRSTRPEPLPEARSVDPAPPLSAPTTAAVEPEQPVPPPVAVEAPGKVKRSLLRASISGTLSAPEEFEQTYFAATPGVAPPEDLARAIVALVDQVEAIDGYLETHKGAQTRLTALKQAADALLARGTDVRPEAAARIQTRLTSNLADLAKNAGAVVDKAKETPQSAAITVQLKGLAETIQRHANPAP